MFRTDDAGAKTPWIFLVAEVGSAASGAAIYSLLFYF